jgi:hypothetical protein
MKATVAVLALLGVSRAVMLQQSHKQTTLNEVSADQFAHVGGDFDDFDTMMSQEEKQEEVFEQGKHPSKKAASKKVNKKTVAKKHPAKKVESKELVQTS